MVYRLLFLLKYYLFFVVVFVVQKPLFVWYHKAQFATELTIGDWLAVMRYGLPLDLSMSGYICVAPFLLVAASVWLSPRVIKRGIDLYSCVVVAVVALIFSFDLDLYTYWNFRLDTTPLTFLKSPKNAFASVDAALVFRQIIIVIGYFLILFLAYRKMVSKSLLRFSTIKRRYFALLFLLSGALFLPIRGGFGDATMNVGWVYFSNNMFLNHAAINPFWNFLDSCFRGKDKAGQYGFYTEERAKEMFDTLFEQSALPDVCHVLNRTKPNIVVVLLEGISANVVGALGGDSAVTPALNRLSREGILFNHFYATSFRTDRGVSSLLSGYPSQPLSCIMKYPAKTGALPHLGRVLKSAGYDLSFYYGGDENFTNMRSYLMNGGFQRIISERDFSRKEVASHWGAADEFVFGRLLADLNKRTDDSPFFSVLLTLSSHEPFTVPVEPRFDGAEMGSRYRNAVYYTDACIGNFVEEAKKQPWWEHTLVVFVSDHSYSYPEGLPIHVPERYHIPMLWVGGALSTHIEVDKVGYQPDFINTLLGQLGLDDADFRFGKNLLDSAAPGFACYTYNHGVGFIGENGYCAIDLNTHLPMLQGGKTEYGDVAKAFLQYTFDDYARR